MGELELLVCDDVEESCYCVVPVGEEEPCEDEFCDLREPSHRLDRLEIYQMYWQRGGEKRVRTCIIISCTRYVASKKNVNTIIQKCTFAPGVGNPVLTFGQRRPRSGIEPGQDGHRPS